MKMSRPIRSPSRSCTARRFSVTSGQVSPQLVKKKLIRTTAILDQVVVEAEAPPVLVDHLGVRDGRVARMGQGRGREQAGAGHRAGDRGRAGCAGREQ